MQESFIKLHQTVICLFKDGITFDGQRGSGTIELYYMKILILSCNTGEGHNSSAKALQSTMLKRGLECDVQDTIALISPAVSRKVSDVYVYSTGNTLFEKAYKIGAVVSDINSPSIKSPVYMTNKLYAEKLYRYIIDNQYDAVICVHLFPAEAITALKRNGVLHLPAIFVMTDYTCIPFLAETELDSYVIPHEDLIEEFVEKGIPREKIVPVGIPVNEEKFAARIPAGQARKQINAEFAWDDADGRWFLLMGGSMGFGNMNGLISALQSQLNDNDRVICICGRNEDILSSIREEFAEDSRIKAVGFTDKVSVLMDASDVLFTKPGGITSTEAIIKNIPLIHTAPIPGLEDRNALFFHYHNMSYSSLDPKQQAAVALRLCEDAAYRKRMLDAQNRNSNHRTCDTITDLVLSYGK